MIKKRDLIHLAVLLVIALVIGVYLIATTVLISKDGVYYIERAQQLSNDPIGVIKANPPGYPFLILMAHKFISLFTDSTSNQTWVYSAQSVTLLFRLLALIPLYFVGKLLVGGKNSFWALVILIFLPYPTRIVSDVVREWPYLLFLSTGFFFLLWSAKSGKWWLFGFVGLSSGLGYLIRHESEQLIVYGLVWVVLSLFRPKIWDVSRWKRIAALILLLLGFAIPVTPYMKCTGQIIPSKLRSYIKVFSFNTLPDQTDTSAINTTNPGYNTAEIIPGEIIKALGEIFRTIGESLMWFFVPALMAGLFCHFRNNAEDADIFFISALVLTGVAMMVLRYCISLPHVSQRWSLPLVTFTVFYIPVGLQIIGNRLNNKRSHSKQKADTPMDKRLSWFNILLIIGMGICMPKLLKPVGIDKQGYRKAANWLRENTAPTDIIAASHKRITFYASRQMEELQNAKSTIYAGKMTSGSWYHLAGTFDGGSQKLYINGKLVAVRELMFKSLGENKHDLVIGKHTAGSTSFFNGEIDDVRLYGRALSKEEVKSLYNNDVSAIESSKLVGYWPLEGDAVGMDNKLNSAMRFNGTSDCIDLSDWGSKLNSNAITISIWVKSELPDQRRWIIGSRTQFRIGVIKSKAYFWILESSPGHDIPPQAAYVMEITNNTQPESNPGFNRKVGKKYSGWVNEREKKKRIVIYEVL